MIADALLAVLAEIKTYSEYYQLTADPQYGNMYKRLLVGYSNFVNNHPVEALAQLNERRNMWIQGEKIFQKMWKVQHRLAAFIQRFKPRNRARCI